LQSDGIQAQQPLNPDELQAMYGIGSRMMTTMGWQIGETLGRAEYGNGALVTALSNVRRPFDRRGVGSLAASTSTSATSPRLQQVESDSASFAARVAKATEAEFCYTCMQALGPMDEVVEYRCRHQFHTHCHRQLVQTDRMQCPVCGDRVVVMEAQQSAADTADADEALGPEFVEGAPGTAERLARRQMTAKLPRWAVFTRPNVATIAEPWVRSFLRHRSYKPTLVSSHLQKASETLEDIFTSFTVKADKFGGQSVTGIIHERARVNEAQPDVAYHGSSMAAVYSILVNGLRTGPSTKMASNKQQISGVFVHKHGTINKARGYMKYWMFPSGFVVAPLFECRVAGPPDRRTCPPDQWCLQAKFVQVTAVHVHVVPFEEVKAGQFWIYGPWDSSLEVFPWESSLEPWQS
jgi:DNA-directed RNA polymerase subunit RPC12/RpoP